MRQNIYKTEGDKAVLLGNEKFQKTTSMWTKLEKRCDYNSHANLHELGKNMTGEK
jgi:hypothetical protein